MAATDVFQSAKMGRQQMVEMATLKQLRQVT